ncbi:MAG: Rieske 2Fe-2S domain-containing protein [Legionellaceae bacterium]|nr:Rieske 2Fe-2S domain-containing protein [Legionellaceae bacterium]
MEFNTEGIEVEVFTAQNRLEQKLKTLHSGAILTQGEYISNIPGYINDMEWNFYDELHRYYVHNTYHDMFKIFSGKTFSVNLIKWGKWPVFIQVANAKVAPNLFYQTMSILGIFYVHQIMRLEQLDREVKLSRSWYTVSHKLFKPLHGFLNRSMMKLQVKQDNEDNEQIRHRRLALRDAGYQFLTDHPNFTNSNQLTNHVIFPKNTTEGRFSLSNLSGYEAQKINIGNLELLIKREENGIKIWPGICPHEGAALTSKHLCKNTVVCPWHGKRFSGSLLNKESNVWQFMNFRISLKNNELILSHLDFGQNCMKKNACNSVQIISDL